MDHKVLTAASQDFRYPILRCRLSDDAVVQP
jgi:hypothetical protein